MHISKELSAQNCWRGALHMYRLRRYAPLDLGFHPVDSGQAYSIRVVDPCIVVSSAGVGHLGWEDSGLASDQVAVLKPLVIIQSGQGCEEPSDNAGAASALKHQRTQALQGALEAPEPRRLHWLQRNVARGRPQSATQLASQARTALDSGSLAPSRAQRWTVLLLVRTRLPVEDRLSNTPHLPRHRSLFEDKVLH
jgi:hypothetical protein